MRFGAEQPHRMLPRLLNRTLAMLNPGCEPAVTAMGSDDGETKRTFFLI